MWSEYAHHFVSQEPALPSPEGVAPQPHAPLTALPLESPVLCSRFWRPTEGAERAVLPSPVDGGVLDAAGGRPIGGAAEQHHLGHGRAVDAARHVARERERGAHQREVDG